MCRVLIFVKISVTPPHVSGLFILIGRYSLYNVVFFSATQYRESAICVHMSRPLSLAPTPHPVPPPLSGSGVGVTQEVDPIVIAGLPGSRRLLALDSFLLCVRSPSTPLLPSQFPYQAGTTTHCLLVTLSFLEFTCQCPCFWNPDHSNAAI